MKRLLQLGTVLCSAVLWTACGAHEGHTHDHLETTAHEAHAEGGHDEIVLHAEAAKAAGVEVETLTPGTFRAVHKVSGRLLAAAGDEQVVVATASGVVSLPGGGWSDGAPVHAGQTLATLSARALTDGDPADRARLEYEAARVEWERAEALATDKLITLQELTGARLRHDKARAAYEGIAARRTAGGSTTVVASMAGYVKQTWVSEGEFVNVGQPLVTLSRSRRIRLQADVPEAEAAVLKQVRSARFRTASTGSVLSLDSLKGRLLSVGQTVAPGAFFLPVTFEFEGVEGCLPGSYAEVWLLGAERTGVLSVPVEALSEEQGQHYVYVQLDEECYRKHPVTVGACDGLRTEILHGLKGGEHVVVKGTTTVRLAGASAAIPAHNHNH